MWNEINFTVHEDLSTFIEGEFKTDNIVRQWDLQGNILSIERYDTILSIVKIDKKW